MKTLYFSNYQLRELALYVSGETVSRWQATPKELFELANRLRNLAEVAPIGGKITVTGEYNADEADGYTVVWTSAKELCLAAAAKAEKDGEERQRSCFSLFRDMVDPAVSPHRTVVVVLEERD